MRENERLAQDVDMKVLAHETTNYSGAEIAGLVRSAQSYAASDYLQVERGEVKVAANEPLLVCQQHFEEAINDIKPVFGSDEEKLKHNVVLGIDHYDDQFTQELKLATAFIQRFMSSPIESDIGVVRVYGDSGSGRTAIASHLALEAKVPFIRYLDSMDFIGESSRSIIHTLRETFDNAYRSPKSIIIIDDIEVPLKVNKQAYDNEVFHALRSLLKMVPYEDSKVLVILTSLDSMEDEPVQEEILPVGIHSFELSSDMKTQGIVHIDFCDQDAISSRSH
jgi:vesicle-fusing ATPase